MSSPSSASNGRRLADANVTSGEDMPFTLGAGSFVQCDLYQFHQASPVIRWEVEFRYISVIINRIISLLARSLNLAVRPRTLKGAHVANALAST